MNNFYRFELEYCGEPQEIGFIVGLKDIGIPDNIVGQLIKAFDEKLTIPSFENLSYKKSTEYPASYFTKKGRDMFYPTIKNIIDYVLALEIGWEVVENVINSDSPMLYQDELQVIVLKKY